MAAKAVIAASSRWGLLARGCWLPGAAVEDECCVTLGQEVVSRKLL